MKKLLLTLVILFTIIKTSYTQVATTYTFSTTTGTYTAITLGTQLATTTAGAITFDTDGNVITLAVGNQFTFNGTVITSINMTGDGALWLNPGTSTLGNGVTGAMVSAGSAAGIICALNMDLRSSAMASTVYERRWYNDGTELIFQWQNCARYSSSTNEKFSFQVRINKSTGVVRIVYGGGTVNATNTYQPAVGLRGTTNADFNNRRLTNTVPDALPGWAGASGTTAGTSNAHTCRFISTASCFPASGLIFIWTPSVVVIAAPANDNSAGAIALTINSSTTCTTTTTGTSVGATQTLAAQSFYGTADDDVWYKFTATAVNLDMSVTRGTMNDLVVEAYTSSLVSIGVIDNYSTSPETVSFTNLTIGNVYYVRVYSYASTVASRGTFTICITTPIQPPANDNASGAITLVVNDSYITGTNGGATASTTAPTPTGPAYYGADIWYKVVVPTGGIVQIRTSSLVLTDAVMEVYSGSSSALTYITYNDDSSLVNAMPYIQLTGRTPGETIWIRIWDYLGNNTGTFNIRALIPVVLPISLVSFTGHNTVDGNSIEWKTASEVNSDYFTLERGLYRNGSVEWLEVQFINGAGNSNNVNIYGYFDLDYPDDINYYRLAQTDYDGNSVTYDIISIDNTLTKKEISSITNILGQEVNENYRGLVIITYIDGSVEKTIK